MTFPTIRLFDQDSHLFCFTATVLTCTPLESGRYDVTLDRTAFFPEGGGQAADPGALDGYPVLDVQENNGIIHHIILADTPLSIGQEVTGRPDEETRLRRMQNHSGEHIVSGLVHARYGFDNVGFHLGTDDVTLDFNGVLTREQLNDIETEANRIVAACLPVKAYYPSPNALTSMTYRSKLELTEHVRIVEIGDNGSCDRCACCAPHVNNTGEIGLIKLLDFLHYKGGIRIHMLCGLDALEDYRHRYTAVASMATAMSVKQADVTGGLARIQAELNEKKQTITALRKQMVELTVASLSHTDGSLCLFTDETDTNVLRYILNAAATKCGRLCGVFGGSDADGYRFVIGRGETSIDLRSMAGEINASLNAKGGGSSEMLQGNASTTRTVIETYFAAI